MVFRLDLHHTAGEVNLLFDPLEAVISSYLWRVIQNNIIVIPKEAYLAVEIIGLPRRDNIDIA